MCSMGPSPWMQMLMPVSGATVVISIRYILRLNTCFFTSGRSTCCICMLAESNIRLRLRTLLLLFKVEACPAVCVDITFMVTDGHTLFAPR